MTCDPKCVIDNQNVFGFHPCFLKKRCIGLKANNAKKRIGNIFYITYNKDM
jgi:hypothetical protein